MKFQWILPWYSRGKQAPARRRVPARTSLRLEILEERAALSANAVNAPVSYEAWRDQHFTLENQVTVVNSDHGAWRDQNFNLDKQTGNLNFSKNGSGPSILGEGSSLIGLDQAFSTYAYRGTGYSVAVIDTGIDYNHPALGGGWGTRVVAGWDFVNNDADPLDDQGHGTHVAGIIGSSDAAHLGVAPNVNLIALKVLDANGSGSFGTVEDALKWVISHQAQYHIVAINMSLGAGNYTANPYDFLEDELTTLKGQGVFIATATGNSFYTFNSQLGVGYPAISPLTVGVGAVWAGNFGSVSWLSGGRDNTTAADRITSFTQRSADLDILAPGAMITSTYKGGGYQAMAGTSMATPVIAGAAAILHEALDATGHAGQANQDYILALMKNTGVTVNDGDDEDDNVINTGMNFQRLNLAAALNSLTRTNQAPVVSPIPNQAMKASQDKIVINLNASDADGDLVIFAARAVGSASPAYQLKQQLGLSYAGSYFINSWGLNEKWLLGNNSQWYLVLPGGEVRIWAGTVADTLLPAALMATFDSSYYADPSLLWNAAAPTSPQVVLTITGNQLTIDPASGFAGNFSVEVTASDGSSSATASFMVTVTAGSANHAPVLNTIPAQTMSSGQDRILVPLVASDVDGDPLNFSARMVVTPSQAYQLDQQNGFNFPGNYYVNAHGVNEKWLLDKNNQWFCLLPSGELRKWQGSISATLTATAMAATLDSSIYNDPSLLWNAQAPTTPPVTFTVVGNQLTVDPAAGYLGSFEVEVTVSDGLALAKRSFNVTVTNLTPVLGAISDQTLKAGQDKISLPLPGSDGDGDTLSYAARAVPIPSQAYQLDQQYGFNFPGSYYLNAHGVNEKWLLDKNNQWFCLLPSGELRKWQGSISPTLTATALVATLDSSFYNDPSLLWNAPAPPNPPVTCSVVGNQLTIDPAPGYLGSFGVEVTVSDGLSSAKRSFTATVTNVAPVLGAIPNMTMKVGQDKITLPLSGSDADGDALSYTARVVPIPSQAYQLDQQYGFNFPGSYYPNAHGVNEKWLLDKNNQWFCLLPSGELRKWQGTIAATLTATALVATLDSSFYNAPSLLWNAQAPVAPAATLTVVVNQLTIVPPKNYLGSFVIFIAVSDGFTTATQSFQVTVG